MPALSPLWILVLGIAVVVGMIVVLRLNAFFAMVTAAIVVSLLAPGEVAEKITRVAEAFGVTAGKIGIPIAMAVVIGKCMLDSGAADRLAQACLRLFGQERGGHLLGGEWFCAVDSRVLRYSVLSAVSDCQIDASADAEEIIFIICWRLGQGERRRIPWYLRRRDRWPSRIVSASISD